MSAVDSAPTVMVTEAAGAPGWPSACRSMLWGVLRLVRHRPSREDDWQTLLEPVEGQCENDDSEDERLAEVAEQTQKLAEEGLLGTMPERVIQLALAASDIDLHMGFSWKGPVELHAFSFFVESNGKLLGDPCWELNCQETDPILPMEDAGDDRIALRLRLNAIPETAYGCYIALVCFHFTSDPMYYSGGLLYTEDLSVRLAAGPRKPDFWRFKDEYCGTLDSCNTWVAAFLYRGPRGRWRLEPTLSKFNIVAFQQRSPIDAVAEAARNLAWRMRYLPRDRAWNIAAQERGLPAAGSGGA